MGCSQSSSSSDPANAVDRAIEKQIEKDRKKDDRTIKVLLLGSGESGKSTVLKQMRLNYNAVWKPDERKEWSQAIVANTVQSMQAILEAIEGFEDVEIDGVEQMRWAQLVHDFDPEAITVDPEIFEAVEKLWQEKSVRLAYDRREEYQLNDSASFFFENAKRIGAEDYVANDTDVLYARVKTTGINEYTFTVGTYLYKVIDVGGQRSERRKWIHCFEGVEVLLFVFAISEYDQTLREDNEVNRFVEAEDVFSMITASEWFKKSLIMLFLNKIDLFKEKLPRKPFADYVKDYRGPNEYEPTSKFLKKKMKRLDKRPATSDLTVHFTCAIDVEQTKIVLKAVQDKIIVSLLKDAHLL